VSAATRPVLVTTMTNVSRGLVNLGFTTPLFVGRAHPTGEFELVHNPPIPTYFNIRLWRVQDNLN
jgi:hypothetical protein